MAPGDYVCYVYVWSTEALTYYADATATNFEFTMPAAAATITLSGAVAATGGTGTISIA